MGRGVGAVLSIVALSCAPGLAFAQELQGRAEVAYPEGIVAIVEGIPITRHELELSCLLRDEFRALPRHDPKRQEIRRRELDELITQHLLVHRAQESKLQFNDEDQARLDRELERQARVYRGMEGLKEALRRVGVPFEYFVLRQRNNILTGKLLVRSISRDIFVTPEDIRQYYAEHQEQFFRPAETRYREIVIYPKPEQAYRRPPAIEQAVEAGAWDARAIAERARARLAAGEPFERVSREFSMGVNHDKDVGIAQAGSLAAVLVPPLGPAIDALQPGEVSEVLEDRRGNLYLVMLVERRERGVYSLEDIQQQIESQLRGKVWDQRLQAWIEEVRAEAHVRVFDPTS